MEELNTKQCCVQYNCNVGKPILSANKRNSPLALSFIYQDYSYELHRTNQIRI